MNSTIKVSIIIPVYNTAIYLRECLDSILNQTLKGIEIICIDDESTDDSLDILNEYENKDDRVRVLQQRHSNAGAARNLGLSNARGEYLYFLDSDDFTELTLLEQTYNQAKKNDADIVVFRAKQYLEKDDIYKKIQWSVKDEYLPSKEAFAAREMKGSIYSVLTGYVWDKLFSKRFVQEKMMCFQSISSYNDAYFVYTAIILAKKITFLDEVLIYQRKRACGGSTTDSRAKQYDCACRMLKKIQEKLVEANLYNRYERDFLNYVVHMFCVDVENKEGEILQNYLYELQSNWAYYFNLKKYIEQEEYIKNGNERITISNLLKKTVEKPVDSSEIAQQTEVNIVYAFDKGYARYTLTSIESALMTKRRSSKYCFYLLVPQNFKREDKEIFNKLYSGFDDFELTFIHCGEMFDDIKMRIEHITSPTYYRLLIPDLIPDCDKILYIDGDTIVCDDLTELYHEDINGYMIAGVPALSYHRNIIFHKDRLNMIGEFLYVNAGVLLMNLYELRKCNWSEEALKLMSRNFRDQDQDIINVSCSESIKIIDRKFNLQTKYYHWKKEQFDESGIDFRLELQAYDEAVIIHYADKIKPWDDMTSPCAAHWWKVALTGICWELYHKDKIDLVINSSSIKCKMSKNHDEQKGLKELIATRNSASYKIGRFITYIPRKVRGGVRCYQEHGMGYTLSRIKYKIKKILKR